MEQKMMKIGKEDGWEGEEKKRGKGYYLDDKKCQSIKIYYLNNVMSEFVEMVQLVDVLINAVSVGCCMMGEMEKGKVELKNGDDPVTEIDHTIQDMIGSVLYHHFPSLQMVGEQTLCGEMIDSSQVSAVKSHRAIQFPFKSMIKSEEKYCIKDLCVFIDPLDCTRGFICNKKWECTILVGVCYKGSPFLGFIGQPYRRQAGNEAAYEPRIMIGGPVLAYKCALQLNCLEGTWRMYENEEMGGGKVAISCRRGNQKQEDVIEALGWSGVPCGGSGNKIAMVVRGEVQAMMLIGMPTSTWDSCAGEAIILGMGGFFIRPDLTSISYHPLPHPQLNTKGFICSLTPSLLEQLQPILLP